jgi:hypothetical protein
MTIGFNIFSAPAMLGANRTAIFKSLRLNELVTIDFAEAKIPRDATILDIGYGVTTANSEDGVFPVEVHGNRPARVHPHRYEIYGRPIKKDTNPNPEVPSEVGILVTWIHPDEDREAVLHLTRGFKEFLFGTKTFGEESTFPRMSRSK